MNIDLSDEALEYGRQALRAFDAAGGDQLVQWAEEKPDRRESIAAPVLRELGAWELRPRGDSNELEAAAALCRSAGYWALAYPVAERLSRPTDLDVDGLVVVAETAPAAALAGLDLRWAGVNVTGRRSTAVPRKPTESPRTSAFVTNLDLYPMDDEGAQDVALGLVLPCWTLLGMLDRAIDLVRSHVLLRHQFGQALAKFQSVQFQLTDAEVERSGVDMLAKYALWSIQGGRDEALDDALALRLATVEAAEIVFRVAHQLHGTIGFCDESALSWISRYSRPLRSLPFVGSATRVALTQRVGRHGLVGLFDDATAESVEK